MDNLKLKVLSSIIILFIARNVPECTQAQSAIAENDPLINVKTYGAKGDYDLVSKKGFNNIYSFQKSLNKGSIFIPKGNYFFEITESSRSIDVPSNRRIVFEKGANIIFGMKDIYYPAFVISGKKNVNFIDPSFIWTGQLTYGPGMDNLDENEGSRSSKRFNTKNEYLNRHYCAAIWIAESNNISIEGFKGESVTRNGKSVIYNWIHAARVDSLYIKGCVMNDMLLGIMSQGGNGGRISNVRADRMSQDVGIPGHVIYSFRTNCPIEDVEDHGIETSLNGKRISHTVSIKNRSDVKNVWSKRSEGVLNVGVDSSIFISNITWKENPKFPSKSTNPKIYFITKSKNFKLRVDNIYLEGESKNLSELIGGSTNNSIFTNLTLIRYDMHPVTKYGFFKLKGNNNEFNARLIESGKFDAEIVKNFNGYSTNNKFNLELIDFSFSPVIRLETGARHSEFKITRGFKSKTNPNNILRSQSSSSNVSLNGNKIIFQN